MLELWRKRTLSDRLYKTEAEDDDDSIYTTEGTEDALIRSVDSPAES